VSYNPNFAHAWDARPSSREIGMAMVRETLADNRTRYINFADVRYFPDARTESTDHPTLHVSFLPGTHNDTRPFFDSDEEIDVAAEQRIIAVIEAKHALRRRNELKILRKLNTIRAAQTSIKREELAVIKRETDEIDAAIAELDADLPEGP